MSPGFLALGLVAATAARAGVWFKPVPGPPDALEIADIGATTVFYGPHGGSNYPFALFAVPGRGAFMLGQKDYVALPCADAQHADALGLFHYSTWTVCGGYDLTFDGATPAGAGLPPGATVTAMANGLVGTSNAGVFSFGATLAPASEGLPPNAAIRSLRWLPQRSSWVAALSGGGVYEAVPSDQPATVGTRLLVSIPNVSAPGVWQDISPGLPLGATVTALGGANTLHAAVGGNGMWTRGSSGTWRRDSNGAHAAVSSIGLSFAAAGSRGVLRRADGGWVPETSGLPEGAEVGVVASSLIGGALGQVGQQLYLGTARHGAFTAFADPSVRTLPVIVDTTSATGQPLHTELTIGALDGAPIGYVFTSVFGLPAIEWPKWNGVAIASGIEIRAPDAVAWLRSLGWAVPDGPYVRSLSAPWQYPGPYMHDVYMIARVYSTDANGGTYGVTLQAPTDVDAVEEAGTVYGLRSVPGVDRSNLAVVPMPGRGLGPITLSVSVFLADGTPAPQKLTTTLAPGEFHQWNDVLGLAGLPPGSTGYARVTRTAGIGAWTGYGVVNDAATSDGSLLPLYRPGGLAAARRLVVPVVLDVFGDAGAHYTTELTLANDSAQSTAVDLTYHPAPALGPAPVYAPVTLTLDAGHQTTIADVLTSLRLSGLSIPPATSGPQAGTLEVFFRDLASVDDGATVAIARTTTRNPNMAIGGRFGVAYPAVARGAGARGQALVPALTQGGHLRTNLAVVNVGGGSESALTLSVQLRNAATGGNRGAPLVVTLAPGEWFQWNRVLDAAGLAEGTAIVTRVEGDDTFFAYAVVNDAKTSDGSYIPMIVLDPD